MGRSSAKICIFEEILEEIFQLSVEHSFGVYVGGRRAVVAQTLFIILLRIWDVARTKSIYISIGSLKELGKYEYFFRVYHNNEIYRAQTEINLGLGWVKVKKPSTLGSSLAKARE